MKRILFFVGFLLAGCETEQIIFDKGFHVRFTDATLTEKESNNEILQIEIHNAGPAHSEDITVSYAITGDAREGIDFEIIGTRGQVTIPANEYFGYLQVHLLNNANNIIRSQDVIFTLTSVNAPNLLVGQSQGGIGKEFKLTIQDDCLLSGSYTGNRGPASTNTEGILISSTDCENYIISNWDVAIFDSVDPMPLNFVDNGDNTLTIPSQKSTAEFGFNSIDVTVKGIGTVNPTTRQIFLSLEFTDGMDTYEVTITFIPE
jgi:hypothetical protein